MHSSFQPPDNEATARREMFERTVAREYADRRKAQTFEYGWTAAIVIGVVAGIVIGLLFA